MDLLTRALTSLNRVGADCQRSLLFSTPDESPTLSNSDS
jgi:hypothetical protein